MTKDDKEAIQAKTKELTDLSGKMTERLNAKNGAGDQQQSADANAQQNEGQSNKADDAVDAEFEEVKTDDK